MRHVEAQIVSPSSLRPGRCHFPTMMISPLPSFSGKRSDHRSQLASKPLELLQRSGRLPKSAGTRKRRSDRKPRSSSSGSNIPLTLVSETTTCSCFPWELIDLQLKQVKNGDHPPSGKYGAGYGTELSRRVNCEVCRVLQHILYWISGCKVYNTMSPWYYFYVLPLATMMNGHGNTLLTSASTTT